MSITVHGYLCPMKAMFVGRQCALKRFLRGRRGQTPEGRGQRGQGGEQSERRGEGGGEGQAGSAKGWLPHYGAAPKGGWRAVPLGQPSLRIIARAKRAPRT